MGDDGGSVHISCVERHAALPFLDLENCRTFGFPVANCRVDFQYEVLHGLIRTDLDFSRTSARWLAKVKLKGKKKGEYHIYEQFKKKPKEN